MASKLNQSAQIYSDIYSRLATLSNGESLYLSKESFKALIFPLRKALKKANLKMINGVIYRRNNHGKSKIIFFPRDIVCFPNDFEEGGYVWGHVVFISVEVAKPGYKVYRLNSKKICTIKSLFNLCSDYGVLSLSSDEFHDLAVAYAESLRAINITKTNPLLYFTGWTPPMGKHPANFSIATTSPLKYLDYKKCIDSLDLFLQPRGSSFEYLFFAATLFSLCKPLFYWLNIKTDNHFCLQIAIETKQTECSDTLKLCHIHRLLDSFADFWCNFREWNARKEKDQHHYKFRNHYHADPFLAWWIQLGFPLLFTNYKRIAWDDESVTLHNDAKEHLNKQELEYISKSACLPILLPLNAPRKQYSRSDCLTFEWLADDVDEMILQFDSTYQIEEELQIAHEHILCYYLNFLNMLNNKLNDGCGKLLKRCYRNALADIGASKEPTIEQQHKACLLSSLYLTRELMEENNLSITNLEKAISYVKNYLGKEVTLTDFANFVRQSLEVGSPYHKIIFYQDKDGIYLHYKEYWPAFRQYCKQNGIILNQGAAYFRRNKAGYIKPQYEVSSPSQYPRFDYRKKVDYRKADVLNISLKILTVY